MEPTCIQNDWDLVPHLFGNRIQFALLYLKEKCSFLEVPNLGSWYLKQIIRDEPLPLFEIPPDKLAPMHKLTMKLMYVLLYMYNVHIILQVS